MKPTLLVLAAGMGSRFGGLKQMEPVGPSGEWILDYSVHDAIAAGFGKVVFVIRQEIEADFRAMAEPKYAHRIELAYALQSKTDTPLPIPGAAERPKPWGTGHAVYAARRHLDAPFAVINADDFYGAEAFRALAEFLTDPSLQSSAETYALVGYELANTLSEHGSVSRGVCRVGPGATLLAIEEHGEITRHPDHSITGRNSLGQTVPLAATTTVSLNCWGFPAGWAARLEAPFAEFLRQRGQEPKAEFYLPAAVDGLIRAGQARSLALPCRARWLGVTHREDLPTVKSAIAALIAEGIYPTPLA